MELFMVNTATQRLAMALLLLGSLLLGSTALAQEAEMTEAQLLEEIKDKGWLGISLLQTTQAQAEELGFAQPLIEADIVFAGSPAEASGFKTGDYIIAFEGDPVFLIDELVKKVKDTTPGTKVKVKRLRDGVESEVPVLIGTRPDHFALLRDHFLNVATPQLVALDHESDAAVDLSAYEGKVVLLDFWATWCPPCRWGMPFLDKLSQSYSDKGLVVLGLTDEEKREVKRGLRDLDVSYQILRDVDRTTSRNFMVNSLPTLFVIDRKGKIREVYIGAVDEDTLEDLVKILLTED